MPPFGWGSAITKSCCLEKNSKITQDLIFGVSVVTLSSSSVGRSFPETPFSFQRDRGSVPSTICDIINTVSFILQNSLHDGQGLAIDALVGTDIRGGGNLSTSIPPGKQVPRRRTRMRCSKMKYFLLQVSRHRAAGSGFSHHPVLNNNLQPYLNAIIRQLKFEKEQRKMTSFHSLPHSLQRLIRIMNCFTHPQGQ